ncbi:MAG: type II 3-dehydroquinate dehydratase [Candidatus Fermentibacteraceae bacterium]
MVEITLINGPNLAALGRREPDVYGHETLHEIVSKLSREASEMGATITSVQADVEGQIVCAVNSAAERGGALIINPGAFSHSSVAIMDSMSAFPGPVIEVHISNIHSREQFRRRLITAAAADAVISGAGALGYSLALVLAVNLLRR